MNYLLHPNELKTQKRVSWFLIGFMISMGIIALGSVFFRGEDIILFALPLCLVIPIRLLIDLRRPNCVSYDDQLLYFGNPVASCKTPLSNIRSITIGRYDNSNKVYLYEPINGERIIHFKSTVFWIPFHFDKTLGKIHELRAQVDRAKKASDKDYEGETRIIQMATLG